MRWLIISSLVFLFIFVVLPLASAEIWVSNNVSDDAWVETKNKSANHNSPDTLRVGVDLTSKNYYKSFIRFELNETLNGRIINHAVLKLFVRFGPNDRNTTHLMKRVNGEWDEDTLTWNNQPNYSSNISDDFLLIKGIDNVWIEFNVTSDIRDFVGGAENYGWVIGEKLISFSGLRDTDARYRPSENVTVAPTLIVDYS